VGIVLLILPIIWFVGAVLVWKYGSRVPRLVMPMRFVALGFFALGIKGLLVAFSDLHLDSPGWFADLWTLLSIPAACLVVAGLVYACANADRIQRTVPLRDLEDSR
jgi:hypothetical protein